GGAGRHRLVARRYHPCGRGPSQGQRLQQRHLHCRRALLRQECRLSGAAKEGVPVGRKCAGLLGGEFRSGFRRPGDGRSLVRAGQEADGPYRLVTSEPYLSRWNLISDGEPIITHSSDLLPVRHAGAPVMLKVARETEERRGSILMAWWDGDG